MADVVRHEWDPDPGMGFTCPVVVVMHPTVADLRAWRALDCGGPDEDAIATTVYDDGDLAIHLAADALHTAVIVHEVVHWALWRYADEHLTPHARASAHIAHHDERIPYAVGNVSALLLASLPPLGYVVDPHAVEAAAS